LYFEYAEFLK